MGTRAKAQTKGKEVEEITIGALNLGPLATTISDLKERANLQPPKDRLNLRDLAVLVDVYWLYCGRPDYSNHHEGFYYPKRGDKAACRRLIKRDLVFRDTSASMLRVAITQQGIYVVEALIGLLTTVAKRGQWS